MSRKAGISRGGALRVGFGRRHVATTVGRYTCLLYTSRPG